MRQMTKSLILAIVLHPAQCPPPQLALNMWTLFNGQGTLPMIWILLDTCSSADLISNPSLLHDIHTVDHSICIYHNEDTTSTNQMGYLGGYPSPVWYNPE